MEYEKYAIRASYLILVVAAIAGFVVLLVGCNQSYLPWVSNPWSVTIQGSEQAEPEPTIPQQAAEDFCEDLRESIDSYRSYLEDETLSESRRRNIRVLVEQYDRECS